MIDWFHPLSCLDERMIAMIYCQLLPIDVSCRLLIDNSCRLTSLCRIAMIYCRHETSDCDDLLPARDVWLRWSIDVSCLGISCRLISLHDQFNLKNPPPPGGFSIYYVSWSRAVCKRFHDEMRPSHLVVKSLTHGSWSGNIVNRKPPRGGGFLSIKSIIKRCQSTIKSCQKILTFTLMIEY